MDDNRLVSTKIAVLLRDDLAPWQRLNVTSFLVSGIAATRDDLIGEDYADKDGVRYLPMFGHPVMVYAGPAELVGTAHKRALDRGLPMSVFTVDLFATNNDVDNRAAVAAAGTFALDLAGIALAGPRNAVDKVLKGARLHP
jgi:hypothetical protein